MINSIEISNLFKEYKLGVVGHGTLYRDMQSLFAKIRGKEDPNSIIGTNQTITKKNVIALNNLNLKVRKGEVLGIIGTNGAGKSTLLKLMSRITSPTKGNIKYFGRLSSLLEVGTGFHPELTGRENIFLNGSINGLSEYEINKKFNEIVEFAGVENFIDTPVKRYSSGMHVRLGFAVAAHLDPDILVVDEVLAVGDLKFQKKAINKMKDVSRDFGRTVLFVSHNLDTVRRLCTRCIILDKGKKVMDGNTDLVIDEYQGLLSRASTLPIYKNDEISGKYYINSFHVLDSNNEINNSFDRTNFFKVVVEYTMKEKSDKLYLSVSLLSADLQPSVNVETAILAWSEKHFKRYKNGSENVDKEAGIYKNTIKIPGYLINSGKYYLNVELVNGDAAYQQINKKIIIDLLDESSSHMFTSGRRGGVIATPLDWEVNFKKL